MKKSTNYLRNRKKLQLSQNGVCDRADRSGDGGEIIVLLLLPGRRRFKLRLHPVSGREQHPPRRQRHQLDDVRRECEKRDQAFSQDFGPGFG